VGKEKEKENKHDDEENRSASDRVPNGCTPSLAQGQGPEGQVLEHHLANSGEGDDRVDKYDRLEVNPLGLHLRSDPYDQTRGRGVYTDRFIHAGTLIEESPVLIITKGQWEAGSMDECVLGEYGFCWNGGGQGIGLGLGEFHAAGLSFLPFWYGVLVILSSLEFQLSVMLRHPFPSTS
jgi:hypothetical protein